MKLYSYFRSSAAYRVRIALNLKGIEADQKSVHLLSGESQQAYREAHNPQGLIPAIESDDGFFAQTLAIIEYLEERYPDPQLLPKGYAERGYVRSTALLIACDIHPLANLRVLKYLKRELGQEQAAIDTWYRHWVEDGFARLEAFVTSEKRSGRYLFGDSPTMADCLLVPQMFNARRLECDLSGFPTLVTIDAHCTEQEAFRRAHPSVQPDAE